MDQRSLGFLPGFTPRRYQRRMPGAGTSVEHSLGANRRPYSTLHSGYPAHNNATSRRTPMSQSVRPLLLTAHPELLDDLLRLCAAAGVEPEVAPDAVAGRRSWLSAPLVVVGNDVAEALVRASPV